MFDKVAVVVDIFVDLVRTIDVPFMVSALYVVVGDAVVVIVDVVFDIFDFVFAAKSRVPVLNGLFIYCLGSLQFIKSVRAVYTSL